MDFSGFERLSLLDYGGKIACVLFSQGCNMRCPYCHNAYLVLGGENPIVPWDDVIDHLTRRKPVIEGVVFSGGEPLLHPDLAERIREVKGMGYEIKLDTNGTFPERLEALIDEGLIDYVAMDIKNSLGKYPETVGLKGFPLDGVKGSAELLLMGKVDYEFRTTIVEEFHDEADFLEIAGWLKGAKRFYLQRYVDREGCIERGFHEVPKEQAERFKSILEEAGIPTELRGYD